MAIAFVAVGTAATNSTAGTTNAPGIPAGLTNASSVMYMAVAISGDKTGSLNTPAGWTKLGASANGTSITLVVYRRVFATGDSAPSVTWTTNNKNTGRTAGYNGCDTTTPEDVAISFATGSGTAPASPSAAAGTRGAMRFHIVAQALNNTSLPDWRMVERADQATSATSAASLTITDERGMAEGATGTRTSTASGSAAWVAATIWIKPAAADSFGLLQSTRAATTSLSSTLGATFDNALTSGSGLVAAANTYHGDSGVLNTVRYTAGNLDFTKGPDMPGTNLEASVWTYQNNTDTTAATVTATTSNTADITLWVGEFLGLPTTGTLIDAQGTANLPGDTGTAVSVSTSSATTSGQRLAVAAWGSWQNESSYTPDANYIPRYLNPDASVHNSLGVETREFAGGSTETATATLVSTNSEWEAALAVLLPTGGGGGGAAAVPTLALLGVGS